MMRALILIVAFFGFTSCSKRNSDIVWKYQGCVFTFKKVSVLKPDNQYELYMLESEVTNKMFKIFIDQKKIDRYIRPIVASSTTESNTASSFIFFQNPNLLWNGNNFPQGQDEFPVTLIPIDYAQKYCDWLMETLNVKNGYFRLPTLEEWQSAVKSNNRQYPWGNNIDFNKFVYNKDTPSRVKSIPSGVSFDGIYDLIGNAEEYIVKISEIEIPINGVFEKRKIVYPAGFVGGSFDNKKEFFLAENRELIGYWDNYASFSDTIGFRIVFLKRIE